VASRSAKLPAMTALCLFLMPVAGFAYFALNVQVVHLSTRRGDSTRWLPVFRTDTRKSSV
jgi:hypothetical protein